ncbi:peptidase family M50-domain-containing protein [Phlyctochytrium arcticum]|nr:peptidase family M50-domain-containing protein [Phlyctochytrium arcticum]
MSLLHILPPLTFFWASLHLVKYYLTHRRQPSRRRRQTLLPLPSSSQQPRNSVTLRLATLTYTFHPRISPLYHAIPAKIWGVWFRIGVGVGGAAGIGVLGVIFGGWVFMRQGGEVEEWDFRRESTLLISSGSVLGVLGGGGGRVISMIPGMTLPVSVTGYYILALLLCGIVHEMGHALAAHLHNIKIRSAGIFLTLMFPGAFVEVPRRELGELGTGSQLQVVCAGVWHNFVLGVGCLAAMGGLPVLLAWGYTSQRPGVVIVDVAADSVLHGHVSPGSTILRVNYERVNGLRGWEGLLWSEAGKGEERSGYCVPFSLLANATTTTTTKECCNVTPKVPLSTLALQCFSTNDQNTCLDLHALSQKFPPCINDTECMDLEPWPTLESDPRYYCAKPYIPDPRIRVVSLMVRDHHHRQKEREGEVLVVGAPHEVYESVRVGVLHPKWSWIPYYFPYMVERFLHFTLSITTAFTLFNMLPVVNLDGKLALRVVVERVYQGDRDVGGMKRKHRSVERVLMGVQVGVGVGICGMLLLLS